MSGGVQSLVVASSTADQHHAAPSTPQHHNAPSNTSYYSPLTPHQAYSQHSHVAQQSAPATAVSTGYNTQSYKGSHSVVNVDDSAPYNRAADKSEFFTGNV